MNNNLGFPQISLFEDKKTTFKIDKPVRLIELFARQV